MIFPKATDILQTIDATLASKVEPSLNDLTSRSAMATIRHLLRLVTVRIDEEGQILADDIVALRKLLPQLQGYFASLEAAAGAAPAKRIETALAEADPDPTRYRSLDLLGKEAGVLRECLYQGLKQLQALRGAHGQEPAYQSVRAAIRNYIVWQMAQEGRLIAPAFYGKGPRR